MSDFNGHLNQKLNVYINGSNGRIFQIFPSVTLLEGNIGDMETVNIPIYVAGFTNVDIVKSGATGMKS